MIKLEHTDVYGFEAAVRGMRNPMNSWDKSDSGYVDCENYEGVACKSECPYGHFCIESPYWHYNIGENDLALMRKLAHAGDDHGKFARFINVTVDITAPLYWWKEFDTYKVGTVSNSCSTMHKIHEKEFTTLDFSDEHLLNGRAYTDIYDQDGRRISMAPSELLGHIINYLNLYRKLYLRTKDKEYWWQMIQLLPSSYNQRRTMQFNYQVLNRIYNARKAHKLDEWREFCDWAEKLPYFREIYLGEGE